MTRANLRRKWSTTISKTTDNLSKAGWSCGCVSAIDSNGRTIWIPDADRDDGKRFLARADEKLTAFLELERANRVPSLHKINQVTRLEESLIMKACRA
ncbi:MAG: hypothetical protein DMF44_01725 [Verrucomicrobia bacterium]|nr:MAG: hypothetical protein DMF44_01725 [Verrucomicrobiota bacterium]